MAHLYHIQSRISNSKPKKPSNCGSDLGEKLNQLSVSLGGNTTTPNETAVLNIGHPGSESQKKVVVVGAGIAGLRAAAVLQRHGIHVTVLEGRDRIGGRICTTRTDKGVRDIG